jgi:LPS O-antigen subunit length determinant protein (WzzB/FepE family)
MKKKYSNHYNEIDFVKIIQSIFNEKKKIFLITTIAIFLGIFIYYITPNSFTSSIDIRPNKNSEFVKLESLFEILEPEELEEIKGIEKIKIKINKIILNRFLTELMDYEELATVLSNNKNVKAEIIELTENDKKQILFDYTKNLTLEEPAIPSKNYHSLSLIWNDNQEAKNILHQTLRLVSNNLRNAIFNELKSRLEIKKNLVINEDLLKIDYLLEQSLIAKELNIYDNQIDNSILPQSNISFNRNTNEIAYYLRGYKVIDKEISLIKKREYKDINSIKNEIINLEKTDIKWVDYNIYLMVSHNSKNFLKSLIVSVLIGLLVGSGYVLVSNALNRKK